MAMKPETKGPLYVVGTDGSSQSEAALDYAIALAKRTGARLRVVSVEDIAALHMTSMASANAATMFLAVESAAREIAAEGAKKARAAGLSAEGIAVEMADPATALVRQAEANGAALVVVGSHGRTGIARVLLGSVAERVVRLSPCPVLVVR